MPVVLVTPQGRLIAYHRTPGQGPGVVFLGGFKSDMTGTKAHRICRIGRRPMVAPSCALIIRGMASHQVIFWMARLAIGRPMPWR